MMVAAQELYDLQRPNNQTRRAQKVFFQKNLAVSIALISKFRAAKVYPAPHHFSIRALYTSYTTPSLAQHQAQSASHNKYVCLIQLLSSRHQNVCLLLARQNKL